MRNWVTAAALGAAALGSLGAIGAQAQDAARPAPPPRGGPLMQADADDDGIVTRDEVIANADRRFAEQDANHDGKLTEDERRAFREQRWGARRAPPPGADGTQPPPGADGALPPPMPGEARHGRHHGRGTETQAQFRDRALRMFDRIDANHDGRIDPQERDAAMLMMRARRIGPNGDRDTPPPPPAREPGN